MSRGMEITLVRKVVSMIPHNSIIGARTYSVFSASSKVAILFSVLAISLWAGKTHARDQHESRELIIQPGARRCSAGRVGRRRIGGFSSGELGLLRHRALSSEAPRVDGYRGGGCERPEGIVLLHVTRARCCRARRRYTLDCADWIAQIVRSERLSHAQRDLDGNPACLRLSSCRAGLPPRKRGRRSTALLRTWVLLGLTSTLVGAGLMRWPRRRRRHTSRQATRRRHGRIPIARRWARDHDQHGDGAGRSGR